jgi:2-aminobenzoate-CoA ligase
MPYPAFDRTRTAHLDPFVKDRLPPLEAWPVLTEGPDYPLRLNAADALIEGAIGRGLGGQPAILGSGGISWTYQDLRRKTDQIAQVLSRDLGLVPGGRVLLRATNTPLAAAAWLAVLKAGGVAVATMPLLRARELGQIADKAKIGLALCETGLLEEMEGAAAGRDIRIVSMNGGALEEMMRKRTEPYQAVPTFQDDPALLAFTSGTTGVPKACIHFHRDILLMADTFSAEILRPTEHDVFIGSPPLAFTFGLGALLFFPFRAGATAILPGMLPPARLAAAAEEHGATMMFTAPTAYRAMLADESFVLPKRIRACVSAGEALPAATAEAFRERTGIRLIDGIGSTEMIHIFVSASAEEALPGCTGRALKRYEARVVDEGFCEVGEGEIGRLVVRGPIGCRYLDDDRQADYVQRGWNVTGDLYRRESGGFLAYVSRADDMIVSGGYNIAATEVEDAVLAHPSIRECAVVAAPHEERGSVVCAFVVPAEEQAGDLAAFTDELQRFVKARIAPYKYPRRIEFLDALPKTPSGKVQRHRLRQMAAGAAAARLPRTGAGETTASPAAPHRAAP